MDFIFEEEKIERSAQRALEKNKQFTNSEAKAAFITGFEQAAYFIERKVACKMEYEAMPSSWFSEITNYTEEMIWKLNATGKEWDYLYEDHKAAYDANEQDFKENIIDRILRRLSMDTQENLMKLSINRLERMLEEIRDIVEVEN